MRLRLAASGAEKCCAPSAPCRPLRSCPISFVRLECGLTPRPAPQLHRQQSRAIDFREGEEIDGEALKTLVRAAVTLNKSTAQS